MRKELSEQMRKLTMTLQAKFRVNSKLRYCSTPHWYRSLTSLILESVILIFEKVLTLIRLKQMSMNYDLRLSGCIRFENQSNRRERSSELG